jgi:hypothetical protein
MTQTTPITQGAVSRRWPISRARALWLCGLATGLIGGYATLMVSPFAAVPALVLWIVIAVLRPRFSGLAGAMVGHGAAWSWLLVTSSIVCLMTCSYTLPYGPAHVTDGVAWQTDTRVWFAAAVIILVGGLLLSALTALRACKRQDAI